MLWDTDWSCCIRKGTSTLGLVRAVFKDAGELNAIFYQRDLCVFARICWRSSA